MKADWKVNALTGGIYLVIDGIVKVNIAAPVRDGRLEYVVSFPYDSGKKVVFPTLAEAQAAAIRAVLVHEREVVAALEAMEA